MNLLFAPEFGSKLNPGKHGETIARELLQCANTRNINHMAVGDRDDVDACVFEPRNNLLTRNGSILIVK